jgi:hypothetical protein
MEKDKLERLINELIVFFWIGLQPTDEIDNLTSEYLKEVNLDSETLIDRIHEYEKKSNGRKS